MSSSSYARWPALLIATAVVAVGKAGAATTFPPAGETWVRAETAHVRVYSDAGESEAIEAAIGLEHLREALATLIRSDQVRDAPPVTAFLFRDDRGFDHYRYAVSHGDRAVGIFVKSDLGNMIAAARRGGAHDLGAIDHEYVHAFLASTMPRAPLWLNEGLAELFSNVENDGRAIRIGLPIEPHLHWLRSHRMMPIDELFSVATSSREYHAGLRQGTFYAESWLAVHQLLLGTGERVALQKYLVAIDGGASASDALQSSFGESPGELERRLGEYLYKATFNSIEVPVRSESPAPVAVRASRADILYELGNLLYRSGSENLSDAIDHYRAAIDSDPAHAGANGMLGTILYGEGKKSEAAAYLARATESMTSTDYLPYLLHGQNLLDRLSSFGIGFGAATPKPPGIDQARRLFERSLELNPGDPWALAGIGTTYLFESNDVGPGVAALERAILELPNHTDLAVYLEILYLKSNDPVCAETVVNRHVVPSGNLELVKLAYRALAAWNVERASELAARGSLDEASSILQHAIEINDDDSLRAMLAANLESVEEAIDLRRLNDLYNEAVRLANDYQYERAIDILRRVVEEAHDDALRRDAKKLLATVEGFKQAGARRKRR